MAINLVKVFYIYAKPRGVLPESRVTEQIIYFIAVEFMNLISIVLWPGHSLPDVALKLIYV